MITKLTTTDGKEYTLFHQELNFDKTKIVFSGVTYIPDELLVENVIVVTDTNNLILPLNDVEHFESI